MLENGALFAEGGKVFCATRSLAKTGRLKKEGEDETEDEGEADWGVDRPRCELMRT